MDVQRPPGGGICNRIYSRIFSSDMYSTWPHRVLLLVAIVALVLAGLVCLYRNSPGCTWSDYLHDAYGNFCDASNTIHKTRDGCDSDVGSMTTGDRTVDGSPNGGDDSDSSGSQSSD